MKDLSKIEFLYNKLDLLLEQARAVSSAADALRIEAEQILNDQAYFLLCWGQLELAINEACRNAIRRRNTHSDWQIRRGWDLYNPEDSRMSGLTFDNRVALVLDRAEGKGRPYAQTMMHYETRNRIAHGRLRSTRIDMPTAIQDFYVIQSALVRGV